MHFAKQNQGLWRHPAQEKQTLDHWVRLAKFLDDNGFHGLFFADVLGIYDVYKGDGPALQSGAQVPILDISLLVSAMAHATKNISFGITASTTYENPYALARKFATLDHITDGRVGWNIVTSYLESAAKSYGLEKGIEHDERYKIADEFLDVVYKLLEGSWQDTAVEADKQSGVWTNPEKVRKIDHVGYVLSKAYAEGCADHTAAHTSSVLVQALLTRHPNVRLSCCRRAPRKLARILRPSTQKQCSCQA
jgi:alkanesulfonate monooxygenase SsuD/methylene tetrahydromethanopterin reductase-like flavin-dependent oxidoreductase (luciferase family)